jgi:hypothetical protein
MKKNVKRLVLLSLLSCVAFIISTTTAQAQWKVSITYEDPIDWDTNNTSLPAKPATYEHTLSPSGGVTTNRIYHWLNQYGTPVTPVASSAGSMNTLPFTFNVTNASVGWDGWKPLLASQLYRGSVSSNSSSLLNGPDKLDIYANARITIVWDTAYGVAPASAIFEGRSVTSQYKVDLAGLDTGKSNQNLSVFTSPETTQQVYYAMMKQDAMHNQWTIPSGFAYIYGGGNTLWESPFTTPYITNDDAAFSGGRVRIPITNGSASVFLGIHQTLCLGDEFISVLSNLANSRSSQSAASTEFRIMQGSIPTPVP